MDKFFNYCKLQLLNSDHELIDDLSMAHPPCCPKLALLSSARSYQAQETQPLMPSSPVQVRGVQVAWQEERQHRQNPDLKLSSDKITLHLCLCQQFFPASSPRPWRKSLVSTHTLANSRFNYEPTFSDWNA